ncbi:hypothetical protein FCM96_01820 [Mycoplasma bovis]|uniref:hypothetical protein n=1 Tax=Mycoplasmopsis bovis TaxID=28903 RepID=UPI001BDE4620|nr:hypothetical protein [Mycoplasmopsis bovis]MBT1345596.1 hypothetical protein [Mycoplasmopsis bovis]MBT1355809.1 hypothetical protein [Mycoplasmopsis bovis]MBT1386469.1 hypothetical protein [Mycoplasmopsis bovis]MBT1395645.1 hypothetical protein [Mycoplasmopsis bovis]MBT1418729.1 hypothetical protein [Mycoplasmopsis bovis]
MQKFSKLKTYGTVLIVFAALSLVGAILDLTISFAPFSFTKLFAVLSIPIFVIVIVFSSILVHQTPNENEFAKPRKMLLVSVIVIPILGLLQVIFQLSLSPFILAGFVGMPGLHNKPFIISGLVNSVFIILMIAFYSVSVANTNKLKKAYSERIKLLSENQINNNQPDTVNAA